MKGKIKMLDSICEIKNFIFEIGCGRQVICLFAKAYNGKKLIYYDTAECRFYYDDRNMQYVVDVVWNIDDKVMHSLGLHGRYNTNYQKMTFDKTKCELLIENNPINIYLKKQKEEE